MEPGERKVAVGWIVEGSDADLATVERARDGLLAQLRQVLPEFFWEMPLLHRRPGAEARWTEPAELIQAAESVRHARHWDLCLVVTGGPLTGRTVEDPLAAVARAFGTAVLTLERLGTPNGAGNAGAASPGAAVHRRVQALAFNLIGRLANLPLTEEDATDTMALKPSPGDLDGQRVPSATQVRNLRLAFDRVADARIEERPERPRSRVGFWLAAVRENRTEILQALRRAHPWAFPLRLGKLTAAAVSTLLVLTLTAEVWDLALRQPPVRLAFLTLAALACTSGFLLWRQRLLDRRDAGADSELRVVANTMIVAIMLLGMFSTYLLVVGASLALHLLLFGDAVVASWSSRTPEEIGFADYFKMSALVGIVGLTVGALGASFESRRYLRHVAFVDEEI